MILMKLIMQQKLNLNNNNYVTCPQPTIAVNNSHISTAPEIRAHEADNHASLSELSEIDFTQHYDGDEDDDSYESPGSRSIDSNDGNYCKAITCLHPAAEILDWVGCDNCPDWFHIQCIGLATKPNENDKFYCVKCEIANRITD